MGTILISTKSIELDFEENLLDQKFARKRTVMLKGVNKNLTPEDAEQKITKMLNTYYGSSS